MPARPRSARDGLLPKKSRFRFVKLRSTKRVSARHQVKRPDRTSKRLRFASVQQKKQVFFVRCGRSRSAVSPAVTCPGWKLVLTCSPTPSLPPQPERRPAFPISKIPQAQDVLSHCPDQLLSGSAMAGRSRFDSVSRVDIAITRHPPRPSAQPGQRA
jgi:hypothetical protein